jgi:hypothetical protein
MDQLSETSKTENPYKASPAESMELAENPEQLRDQLHSMFAGFEKQFRKERPFLWRATLLAPVVVSATLLGLLWIVNGFTYAASVLFHATATFFVLGRFVLLAGVDGASSQPIWGMELTMSPGELFALVTYLDFMTALFVTFHMGILFKIPKVGPKLAMLVWDGKFFMDSQPWIKRMAFAGLVTFVIFPTSTTGSIGGSIFGRLLGLSRWATVGGVLLGSLLGNTIMYAFAKQINKYLEDNWTLRVVGLLIIVLVCVAFEWRYRKVKDKYIQDKNDAAENAS